MGLVLVKNGDERGDAPLTDIVGMLRKVADRLERGDDPMPEHMLWVAAYEDGEIALGAFGAAINKFEVVGMLQLAQRTFSPTPGDAQHS